MSAPNGCTGQCCAVFYVPWHKDELAATTPIDPDDVTLKQMLIPLTRREVRARRAKFGISPTTLGEDTEGHWYKCRHWDEDTRLCTIYDSRPTMCRDFPYARKCDYGCDYRPPPSIIQQYINDAVADKARPR